MSHEEFGFVGGDIGQITLLCDVAVMVYAMCLLGRSASAEMEAPFLCSMTMSCHYDAALHLEVGQLVVVCSSFRWKAVAVVQTNIKLESERKREL